MIEALFANIQGDIKLDLLKDKVLAFMEKGDMESGISLIQKEFLPMLKKRGQKFVWSGSIPNWNEEVDSIAKADPASKITWADIIAIGEAVIIMESLSKGAAVRSVKISPEFKKNKAVVIRACHLIVFFHPRGLEFGNHMAKTKAFREKDIAATLAEVIELAKTMPALNEEYLASLKKIPFAVFSKKEVIKPPTLPFFNRPLA